MFTQTDCVHANTSYAARIIADGRTVYCIQCLDCGDPCPKGIAQRFVKRPPPGTPVRPFNAELHRTWKASVKAGRRNESEQRQREWWERYSDYLDSPEWQAKREAVLQRDGYRCRRRGCGQPATHVHHLTYEHVGNEPLEDLVSACTRCHAEQHPHRHLDGEITWPSPSLDELLA